MGIFDKKIFCLVFVIFFCHFISAQNTIDLGWQYVSKGDVKKAEQTFKEALDGPDKFRANLALSFLYEFNLQEKDAWKYYYNAIKMTDDYPYYLFAGKASARLSSSTEGDPSALEFWKNLSNNSTDGFMQAQGNESLGRYYRTRAQIDEAKKCFAKMQPLLQWSIIGPFENVAASGFDEEFFPEKRFAKNERGTGKGGIPVCWVDIPDNRLDGWIDFESFFANSQSVFYSNCFVNSPKKQIVQIRIGTSGSFKVLLNDANILSCNKERNNDLDTYIAEVTLNEGWNKLLVKTGYSEIKACNFLLRITDTKGFPVSGLKYSTEAQNYASGYSDSIKTISSIYEKYFQQAIKQHPEYPENYLLLSDLYCLNDKVDEANDILTQGLRVTPDNPIMLNKLSEVYTRAGKRTELLTNNHKLEEINPDFLVVLQLNAQLAYENKNNPEYERIIKKMIDGMSDGADRDCLRIAYLAINNQPRDMIALVDSAYAKYPDNWKIVGIKAGVDYAQNRDYTIVEKIVNKYSVGKTEIEPLKELMDVYVNLNKVDEYEGVMRKIHELEPADPNYYYYQATTYFTWQKYERAEELIKKALELCPSCALYHEYLGNIYKAQGKLEACRMAYKEGIAYSPSNYKLRDKLNDVSPESLADKTVVPFVIKDVIKKTDAAPVPAGKDVLLVLNDVKRKIFQEGSSENEVTLLYKVLSQPGIKQMSEYSVRYYESVQEFILDKAVVIKKDGSEISADHDDAHFVFKSIDVNDYVLIKYKIQNEFSGALSEHFWDEFSFSSYSPALYVRYSLICPENKAINYKGQNFDAKPSIDTVLNHERLLCWEMRDIPEIVSETEMPDLIDVSKVLFLSSIPDWNFLSSWFNKISRSRVESSREIQEQVAGLFDKNRSYSEREKAHIIYDFITNNITYSSVSFRQSAFVPQKAKDVLVSRLGDCKDVAGLFIAMAREAGLQASFVLVNTRDEGSYKNALPGLYFNHAIASVIIDHKPYLLDLTAKYYPFMSLPMDDLNAMALPVSEKGEDRIYTQQKSVLEGRLSRIINAELTPDNTLKVHREDYFTGECGADIRNEYLNRDSTEQIKTLTENLSSISTNMKVLSFTITPKDTTTDTLHVSEELAFNNYLTSAGNFKILKLPWSPSFDKAYIVLDKREYPLGEYFYANSADMEINIKLPEGYTPVELPESFSTSCMGGKYSISFGFKAGVLSAKRSVQYANQEISPAQYADYKAYCNKIIDAESTQILLKKK
jgi:tetratricopeptide (TPR) repeat protein